MPTHFSEDHTGRKPRARYRRLRAREVRFKKQRNIEKWRGRGVSRSGRDSTTAVWCSLFKIYHGVFSFRNYSRFRMVEIFIVMSTRIHNRLAILDLHGRADCDFASRGYS